MLDGFTLIVLPAHKTAHTGIMDESLDRRFELTLHASHEYTKEIYIPTNCLEVFDMTDTKEKYRIIIAAAHSVMIMGIL